MEGGKEGEKEGGSLMEVGRTEGRAWSLGGEREGWERGEEGISERGPGWEGAGSYRVLHLESFSYHNLGYCYVLSIPFLFGISLSFCIWDLEYPRRT